MFRTCSILLLGVMLLSAIMTDETSGDESIPPTPSGDSFADSMTLEDAIDLAVSINPNLAKAAADVEAARGKAVQVRLYPNPILQGGATQLAGNESQYYFGLSQEIVTKHKLQLNEAAANREVFQAELSFIRIRFDLLTAIRQTFFTALGSQRRIDVLTKLVEIARKSSDAAERMRFAGETSRADTLLFEIEVEKSEVALENAEVTLAAAHKELASVIGIRDLKIERLKGNLKAPLSAIDQVLVAGYVPYNANVQIAEQEIERSRLVLQRAKVEPFPNVTLYSGYQYQVSSIRDMGLLGVSVPLPVWNQNQGNIYTAHAHINKAMANVSQVQNQISRHMAEWIGRYQVADQQVRRFEERILPKAREGVAITQKGFANGNFDSFRLLQSQRGLVESNLGYIAALESRWMAAAELASLAQLETFP